jgi:hypothetical protein
MALEGTQEYIDINKIELDVENPRIKRIMEALKEEYEREPSVGEIELALSHNFTDDDEVLSATKTVMTFERLKKSIVANKGILSPIIIKILDNNTYKCIEGNTRLSIYKMLNNEFPDDESWKKILATTYENIDSDDENAIRLQSHLVPPRPWDPYSRAKYLNELKNLPNWDLERVSGICGMQATEVQQYVETYEIMERYYKPYVEEKGEMFDIKCFSGFLELVKKHNAIAVIKSHGYDLDNFSEWIHHRNKIKKNEHVRSLKKIFDNEQAKQTFLDTDSNEALKVFLQPSMGTVLEDATLTELMQALTLKIGNVSWREISQMADDTTLLDDCADLVSICQELIRKLG